MKYSETFDMRWLSVLLLLVIEAAIISVAVLARPERIGELDFWLIVAWLLFLVFLNWAVSSYIFLKVGDDKKSTEFGVLPSLNILVFVYSIISASLLAFSWNIAGFGLLPNWHIITQVITAAVTAVVAILMFIAAKGAAIEKPDGVKPKEELVEKIKVLISTLPAGEAELEKDLIRLRDYIQYSMPHTARIKNVENYGLLYSQLYGLDISKGNVSKSLEEVNELLKLAKSC